MESGYAWLDLLLAFLSDLAWPTERRRRAVFPAVLSAKAASFERGTTFLGDDNLAPYARQRIFRVATSM
jgi:hypothetical protein